MVIQRECGTGPTVLLSQSRRRNNMTQAPPSGLRATDYGPPEKVIEVDAKTAARLFKRYSVPYVHGPFGPPTPPTVQQAIDKGALYATLLANKDGTEMPQVLVIANQLKSSSTHVAFNTDELPIRAGELYASDIAKAE